MLYNHIYVDVQAYVYYINHTNYYFDIGAEIQKSSYDQCTSTLCSNSYTWFQCRRDCFAAGYTGRGDCASRSHNEPKRCCCRNK